MEPREPCCALNIVSGCHGEGKEPGPTEADGQMDRQGVPGALDSTQRGMCRMQESDQGTGNRREVNVARVGSVCVCLGCWGSIKKEVKR